MPTPIPISPDTAVVQSGTSTTLASSSDQAAGRDAEADERDHERQAGGDDRAEGDQQHDRGAEEAEPLGARLRLRGVDRVAAELDLEPVAAVAPRRRRSASRRPPWSTSQPGTVSGSVVAPILPSLGDPDRGVRRRCGRPSRPRRRRRSMRCSAAALRRRPGPSRRRRSPGRSSRRSAARSGRSPPSTRTRACCSRRCTRPRAEEPTPMITIAATIQASTMRPRRR